MIQKPSLSKMLEELQKLLALLTPVAAVFSFLALFSFKGWLCDLVSHFQIQYFIIGICGAIVFSIARKPLLFLSSIIAVFASSYLLLPFLTLGDTVYSSSSAIRVAVFNIHTANSKYVEVRNLILSKAPTFFVVLEIDKRWADELEQLVGTYPYRHQIPRRDNFGIAVFSKRPFKVIVANSINRMQPPIIGVTVDQAGQQITLYSIHPVPPATPGYYSLRNQLLATVGSMVRQSDTSTVVLGDLNTAMWSRSFEDFVLSSGLQDPRKEFGLLPTWPQFLPLLYIPIEHILVSSDMKVSKLETISIPGSDHRGMIAEIDVSLIEATP